jgi:hypothetical protein
MWKARGLRFPSMREIPFQGFEDFPHTSFPLLLGCCGALPLFQESAELPAGGFQRPLLLLRVVVVENGTTILDHVKDQSFHWHLSQSGSFMEIADHFAATEARGCSRVCEWLYFGASCSALHHSAIERLNASSARARVSLRKFRSRSRALDFESYRQPSEDDRNPSGYGDTARTRGIRQRTFERDSEADVAGALLGYLAGRVDRTFNRVHVWLE